MDWLLDLRPIRLFSFYLAFVFCLSIVVCLQQYRAVAKVAIRLGSRWPNLLKLILEHRAVLLGWGTVRPLLVMLALIVANSAACHLVWPSAGDFKLRELPWPVVPVCAVAGVAMLAFDLAGLLNTGTIDEKETERYFDRAEWWLRGWKVPAMRLLSFGWLDPRAIVGKEVRAALEGATGWLAQTFWWMATQAALRIAFGLSLWAAWIIWLLAYAA
ncbi:MAG: hypothetical protein K2W96_21220 [Gemmataceae bacterium]|nr:hypothetical protein [Gemmataceae bacterium]